MQHRALKAAIALAATAPLMAHAESNITSGTGAASIAAAAHLDFQVTIPKVLFLQVGAGTNMAANATVNQIAFTVPAANTSATPLAHPTLADGATTTVNLSPATGSKVVSQDAKWTFTYKNTAVAAPGTYGGVNAQNSRVTYTASMP